MENQNSEKVMRVIEVLNKARSMELQSIHQYMNQHYNLDDLDYGKFAASIKRIAIDEMDHAEQFAERIKELDGEPGTEMAAKVVKKQALKEVYPFDARLEADVLEAYNGFLALLGIYTGILAIINFTALPDYMTLLNACVAFQVGHFFRATASRRGYILIVLLFAAYTSLYLWANLK